jgi:cell fate regulator YaaT (PSP1 superfamily)
LRCCLIYEYPQYVEWRQQLPKRNKHVRTPQGDGKVIDVHPLQQMVVVDIPEHGIREFNNSEIILLNESGQPIAQLPPEPPCNCQSGGNKGNKGVKPAGDGKNKA